MQLVFKVAHDGASPVRQFVGRRDELAVCLEALARAVAGRPSTLLVVGEAGVGKSRLVEELLSRAKGTAVRVLAGACIGIGKGQPPYLPFVEGLRELLRELPEESRVQLVGIAPAELATLVPELTDRAATGRSLSPLGLRAGGQARMFELVAEFLARLAAPAGAVVVVEDLHWADPSTRELFTFLACTLRRERVLLVGTVRSEELAARQPLRASLAELQRGPETLRIDLARFGRSELAELLSSLLGAAPSPVRVGRIFERSGGNAFYAEQLVAAAEEGAALPPRLRDVLLARVDVVSEPAREVLRLAATAGVRMSHRLLAAGSPSPEGSLLGAVRELVERRLLIAVDEHGYAFPHALLQEAVYADLLPGERRRHHAALADAIADGAQGAEGTVATQAGWLARHRYEAGDFPRALGASVEAGRAAEAAAAFADAAQHYERALALWDGVTDAPAAAGVDRVELLGRAGESAGLAGATEQALARLHKAVATLDPAKDSIRIAVMSERLARQLQLGGRTIEAVVTLERAARLVPEEPPSCERARVLATWANMLMLAGRLDEARCTAEQAAIGARRAASKREEGDAVNTLGLCEAAKRAPESGIAHLREALAIATDLDDAWGLCRAHNNLAYALNLVGRFDEGSDVALIGVKLARRVGLHKVLGSQILASACHALFRLGRWDETEELLAEAATESWGLWESSLTAAAFDVDLARGRLTSATVRVADLLAPINDLLTEAEIFAEARSREAELSLARGDPVHASHAIAVGLEEIGDCDHPGLVLDLLTVGVRAAADRAEHSRLPCRIAAAADADQLATRAREAMGVPSTGLVAGKLALLEAERHRARRLVDPAAWAAAVGAFDVLAMPYPAAYSRFRQAEAQLGARSDKAIAATLLRAAHQTCRSLGAAPLLHDIETLARRARIVVEPRAKAPRSHPKAPSAVAELGLSPRELEVLALLTLGRTNPQIAQCLYISRKTAGHHVSSILIKLGVATRGEAVAVAHRLGLQDVGSPRE